MIFYLFFLFLLISCENAAVSWYESYCTTKEECNDYSGERWRGQFAYHNKLSKEEVQNRSIVSVFPSVGKKGMCADIKTNNKEFRAEILDTCGDSDCRGCCTRNKKGKKYLLDIEYYTAVRQFGKNEKNKPNIPTEAFIHIYKCKDENENNSTDASYGLYFSVPTKSEKKCSWSGHCLGDKCKDYNDCSDNLICKNKKCVNP